MDNLFLIFYKGKGNLVDKLIRVCTCSPYSHCEIAEMQEDGTFLVYSSSPRDGGVRMKKLELNPQNWDLIPIQTLDKARLKTIFNQTQGMAYDYWGAVGIMFPFIKQKRSKWFCSEWCANVMGLPNPSKYSPEKLFEWAFNKVEKMLVSEN